MENRGIDTVQTQMGKINSAFSNLPHNVDEVYGEEAGRLNIGAVVDEGDIIAYTSEGDMYTVTGEVQPPREEDSHDYLVEYVEDALQSLPSVDEIVVIGYLDAGALSDCCQAETGEGLREAAEALNGTEPDMQVSTQYGEGYGEVEKL